MVMFGERSMVSVIFTRVFHLWRNNKGTDRL